MSDFGYGHLKVNFKHTHKPNHMACQLVRLMLILCRGFRYSLNTNARSIGLNNALFQFVRICWQNSPIFLIYFDPTQELRGYAIAAMVFSCMFGSVPNFEIGMFSQSQKPIRCFVRFPRKIGVKSPGCCWQACFLRGVNTTTITQLILPSNYHLYLPIFRLASGEWPHLSRKKKKHHPKNHWTLEGLDSV